MSDEERSRRQYLKHGSIVILTILTAGCITEDATADPAPESKSFSITANDQTGSGETVTVEEVSAEMDYFVHAHYNDETASSDAFEAGTTQEELRIDLDPQIDEDVSVRIGIHAEEDGERFTGDTTVDIEYTVE